MSGGVCSNCKSAAWQGASSQRSFLTTLRLAFSDLVGLRAPDAIPIYWENAHKNHTEGLDRDSPDFFDDMYPVDQAHREILQDLINITSAEGSDVSLRLVNAMRVENSAIWGRYQCQLKRLRRKRGPCTFAGRGAPLTDVALEQVEGSGSFTQELDDEVCEAYLWHGTRPQVALQIVQNGFQVGQKSKAGKRFGQGGYFSEDPAKADFYAGAGEGLYKDCYAMLLCRVALGKQFHVRSFREEGATDHAGSRFDSTLAEPRGASWREFVAFRSEQVYPEYALVYERCSQGEGDDLDGCLPNCLHAEEEEEESELAHEFPDNWFHSSSSSGCFHCTYPAESMRPVIQALMESTWSGSFTRDRKSLSSLSLPPNAEDVPQSLRVLKVLRLEDSEMWKERLAIQESIRESRGECTLEDPLEVQTTQGLPERERWRLADDVNEVYLWHGSSPQRIMSIIQSGFPASQRRFNHGMFGDGAYFVESSAYADEYSRDDEDGYYKGYYAMVLCRVTLGNPQVLPAGDPEASSRIGLGLPFDSAVGERQASKGAFREFFVTTHEQVYPEYAIIYERMYDRPKGHSLSRSSSSGV